jgi:8-oxo-dGTP diphosphatase
VKRAAGAKAAREVSAGGVVRRGKELLLVKVEDLEGRVLWTFPKGHLERSETALQAALREVEEETGWRCRKTGSLGRVHYRFTHEGRTVAKTVHWYSMEPVRKTGLSDPDEILDCRWTPLGQAAQLLSYGSDLQLLKRVRGLRPASTRRRKATVKARRSSVEGRRPRPARGNGPKAPRR